ncbi:NAD(P)-dependent oxidoreductase [Paenibacillus xylaniclasticus]|uniref:NAD(P)-dependent oxidoreductase n=1 Tax=Paenibacillus xylaniclasticus TaxID=588083 RepID=UPI000FDAD00E|nr:MULTISPECIES: NAD(P)-binding oxidoreductase [Paenibacillus]GFN32968.1 hypothetical protein PCURB6_32280 [Paenibacillus curdlanolyticus]
MKIIVFGATGGVGQFVVKQGLEAGLKVTAFVRNPAKLEGSHSHLRVIQGDALNQEEVTAAIAGHDVVVSCLGSSKGMKKSTELQEMAKCMVNGMQEHHITRIVYTASAGVHRELSGAIGKLVMAMLRNPLADHRAAVDYIQAHGLNYTIVRPMGLTNHPFTGRYREAAVGVPEKSRSIPRADVAHFIIKALQDPRYDHTSIGLAT